MRPRTRSWRARAAVGATVVAMGLLAGACGGSSTPSSSAPTGTEGRQNKDVVQSDDKPKVGGKLVYGLIAETNGWNPATNNWGASGLQVSKALFDTLSAYDESSQIKPNLAKAFDHNADYTEWTMTLRPDVKLHNGKVVDADLVAKSQNYLMASPLVGPAYTFGAVDSFRAEGKDKVVVKLEKANVLAPVLFATQLGVVVDYDWLVSNDSLRPIGTGPFKLDTWVIDQKLSAVKNQDYWQTDSFGQRLPYLDSIEFRVIIDSSSRAASLKAKDIDVMESTGGQALNDFKELDGYQIYADSKGESVERMIMLNTQAEPTNDPEVRRALAMATDSQAFSDEITQGYDPPADGPTAPNSPYYTKTNYPAYDPEGAKALIEKAKERHGGKIEVTINGSIAPESQLLTQLIQQEWAAVGVDVKVDLMEQAKLIIVIVTGKYQATSWLQFDAPIPYQDGVWIDTKGAVAPPEFALNFSRIEDEEIGKALDAYAADPTIEGQKKQWGIVQQRLGETIPFVWLAHSRISIIASERVVNLTHYELPDGGGVGLDLQQGAHSVKQIWLRD